MSRIFLIRHGEAENNGDDIVLTEKGHKEAEALAERLLGIRFEKIYVSKMTRAQETLEHYREKRTDAPEIIVTDKLNEIYRVLIGGATKEGIPEEREENDRKRADAIWDEIISNEGNVAVFCHGNIIRYFIKKVLELNNVNFWDKILILNASISVIEKISSEELKIASINEVEHLLKSRKL